MNPLPSVRAVTRGFLLVAACAMSLALIPGTTARAADAPAPATQDSATGQQLTLSPLIVTLSGASGDTLTENVSVTASGSEPLEVAFNHADFGFDNSSYAVQIIADSAPETTAFSTRDWFTIPRATYKIPAGKTEQIPLRIAIPDNTPGGTYLGIALFRVLPHKDSTAQVRPVPSAGPLVFISVAGGDPPKPRIKAFDIPGVVSKGPVRPRITVDNQGDEWFSYSGSITLERAGKDERVEVGRQFVVPGQPRRLRVDANAKGRAGEPVVGKQLGFGHYTVQAKLRIEPTGKTVTSTREFWVIPTWMRVLGVLAALLVLVGIPVGVWWTITRRRAITPVIVPSVDEEDEALDEEAHVLTAPFHSEFAHEPAADDIDDGYDADVEDAGDEDDADFVSADEVVVDYVEDEDDIADDDALN